mmetsp:Transcript_90933/g.161866  ORF Transcript_90933/g.161866 Transcript_90933/m.161866 type:complete len:261 (+) Transcript_90933:662-1444(+)
MQHPLAQWPSAALPRDARPLPPWSRGQALRSSAEILEHIAELSRDFCFCYAQGQEPSSRKRLFSCRKKGHELPLQYPKPCVARSWPSASSPGFSAHGTDVQWHHTPGPAIVLGSRHLLLLQVFPSKPAICPAPVAWPASSHRLRCCSQLQHSLQSPHQLLRERFSGLQSPVQEPQDLPESVPKTSEPLSQPPSSARLLSSTAEPHSARMPLLSRTDVCEPAPRLPEIHVLQGCRDCLPKTVSAVQASSAQKFRAVAHQVL